MKPERIRTKADFSGLVDIVHFLWYCKFVLSSYATEGTPITNNGAILIPRGNQTNNDLINVQFHHCYFEADNRLFSVDNGRIEIGNTIQFRNCHFVSRKAGTTQNTVPAYIKGVVSCACFKYCKFEITDFASTNDEENSHNGVFFYFDSDKNKKMYWSFDHCAFVNSTGISVNSPILSNSGNDSKETVFCSVRNCMIKGFRWIIRIATTKDFGESDLNPCFDSYGTDLDALNKTAREKATALMNEKKRFLSQNNYYLNIPIVQEMGNKKIVAAEVYGG